MSASRRPTTRRWRALLLLVLPLLASSLACDDGSETTDPHDMNSMQRGPTIPTRPLTATEQRLFDVQLERSRAAVPGTTVQDALRAGYEDNGDATDSEVHLYLPLSRLKAGFDPSVPPMVLAESGAPDARLLALVYWVDGPDTDEPEGFAGPMDQWHRHGPACMIDGEIVKRDSGISDDDGDVPEDRCRDAGGTVVTRGGWMLHVWVIPGVENPYGLFAT